MRLALAVGVAALAQLVVYLRVGDWYGATALVALAYLLLAAAGAGYFAGRRAALAGFLSVIVGALCYALVSFAGAAQADAGSLLGWVARLVVGVLPYALGGGVAGMLGGALRARLLRS